MRYTTLGNDVLDTSDYGIIATAKTNEIAESIASAMNAAQQSVQADGAWVCDRCGHNATSQYCSNCNLPFPRSRVKKGQSQ